MSIRFDLKGRTLLPTQGRVIIRRLETEDWGPSDAVLPVQRFEDRGSITDPVGPTEDWGELPKAQI